jgi:hypothetical protein
MDESPLDAFGPAPSPEELAAAVARSEQRVRDAHEHLYSQSLPLTAAADRLGVDLEHVSALLGSGELLAIDGPDGARIPAWQLTGSTPDGLLPGVQEVAAAFPYRTLELSFWVMTPNAQCGGRTPREAMAAGEVDRAVAAARVAIGP